MPTRFLLLLALFCGTGALTLLYLLSQPPRPTRLIAIDPIVDVGERFQGEKVEMAYELVNHFPMILRIEHVLTSCGCSTPTVSTLELAPQGRSIIRLNWDLGASRGPVEVVSNVLYQLEDGRKSRLNLLARARVQPDIERSVDQLQFASAESGKQVVRFSPGRLTEIQLSNAYCSHNAFQASLDRERLEVTVTFDPDRWSSESVANASLIVHTNSKHEPACVIPIHLNQPTSGN